MNVLYLVSKSLLEILLVLVAVC